MLMVHIDAVAVAAVVAAAAGGSLLIVVVAAVVVRRGRARATRACETWQDPH